MRAKSIRNGLIGLTSTLAVVAGLLGSIPVASAISAVPPVPPTIAAKPDNVMVNTVTTLTGKGFAKHISVTVEECSVKTWVVMTNPCGTTNTVTVRTNGKGSFRTNLTVQACPPPTTPGPGLSMLCYIGVPHPSGIDTVALQPETSIVVTHP